MSKTLNTRVKLKYDSSTNWSSIASTFIPLKGEVIFYSDLSEFKLGDGTTTLANLSYFKPTPKGDFVTVATEQTISGKKTFSAPTNVSGTEQATSVFKTANGGQIIFGKEAGNSGTMIGLDQVAGTRRLNFRASATAGAIVWTQPETNSQLYYDVAIVYFRQCTKVTFDNASTITLSKFKNAGYLYTDSSGNLKSGSLASVATSGKYSDLTGTPTLASVATSGSYDDLLDKPTITDTKNTAGSTDYGITGSPLYLIGASSQAENPRTYSSKYCYIQYGSLYSYGRRVAETYTKDSEHYIQTEAGYYKISEASSKNSDGTYNDVTILTTENIAEKGLFVPMTGTINTAMSGGIHQQIAFDVQTSSGGLTPAGGGSTTTSTRYAEAFYGEKGFEYVHYLKDPNYGTNDSTAVGSYGITYKPFDGVTNTGYYTTVDTLLNEGLNIWKLSTQGYGTNTGSGGYYDYLQFVSILPDATLKYKVSGSSSYTSVDLKNLQTKLVSGTSIKTINSKSLLGSGNLTGTDIVPKASNTKNESSVPNYGLMGMYCYYYTGGEKGYANIVNSTRGVFIRFGIFTASSNGTAKTISFDSPMSMCIGTSTVIRSAHSVSVMLVDGSGMSSNATYRNSNAVTAVSYSGFTYVNGNSETGTIRYLAIGVFGD